MTRKNTYVFNVNYWLPLVVGMALFRTEGSFSPRRAPTLCGEHAFMRISGATAEYYLEDAMGSVIGIANGSGALSQSIDYDSFGNVLNGATLPSDTAGEFRFHGMWLEPTGLYHVRARHYDASTG